MLNSTKLMRSHQQWRAKGDPQATIFITGWGTSPHEPILLEALANHPGCKKLYYIPLDGKGEANYEQCAAEIPKKFSSWVEWSRASDVHVEVLAYDITTLLQRRGGPSLGTDALDRRLTKYFRYAKPRPVSTADADLYMAGHGEHKIDGYFLRHGRQMGILNFPQTVVPTDQKTFLPKFARHVENTYGISPIPPSQTVYTNAELAAFMDAHQFNEVILKTADDACGKGIYRVFRDGSGAPLMAEYPNKYFKPTKNNPRIFAWEEGFMAQGMLAMEMLDNSKGDIRVVIFDRKAVGAYKRMPPTDHWLCNYSQGGSIEPVDLYHDLTSRDRRLINVVAKTMEKYFMNSASIDLLANSKGERFLSEINIGHTDDMVELEKHWGASAAAHGRMSPADQLASAIMDSYKELRNQVPSEEMGR